MCETCTTYSQVQVNQYDPTRTLTLRNAFVRNMNRRFRDLVRVIRQTVVDQDCFGLAVQTYTELTPPPGYQAFNFPRVGQKVEAFMEWLRRQEERGLLETIQMNQAGSAIEAPWTNIYIQDSYKRGVLRARYELSKAGYNIPSLSQFGGASALLSTPFHIDRVGMVYTRAFEQLRGITTAMDLQISTILAQGLVDGDGPALLARKLVSTINGGGAELGLDISYINPRTGRQVSYFMPAKRRAEILARTETIRAHHQGMVQEYKNWAADGFVIQAEFTTAGDDRVCTECAGYHGNRYSLDEIEHLIPIHPQCRCIALPVEVERR